MTSSGDESVLVYDVGGSHFSAAVCRLSDFHLGPVVSAHHPEMQTKEAFFDVLASLALEAGASSKNLGGASLAMPGPFDYAEGVSWMRHKLPYLYGVNVRQALADRLGWMTCCRIHFLNDAAAFALGEVAGGAGRGYERVVGITLGTGVGSGFAVDGHIVTEGTGVPRGGEVWNVAYGEGIVEDVISTRAVKKSYRERTGQQKEVAEIASEARVDRVAAEVFQEFGRNLGRALEALFSLFDPDVIVIGGGIARSSQLFLLDAQKSLGGLHARLCVSELGDGAPLVGAAAAWASPCACKGKAQPPA